MNRAKTFGEVLVHSLLVALSVFVGGPVLGLMVLSMVLFAIRFEGPFGHANGLVLGGISALTIILTEFVLLVPLLRSFSFTRTVLFDEQIIEPFVARDTTLSRLIELNLFGALVIAIVPALVAGVACARASSFRNHTRANLHITCIAFLPLVIAVFRKWINPIAYLVSTTSGDGRNNFLHVQRIRVTSGFTSASNFSSQGDFGASLSSLVSDGLGSNGLFRFNDQYAIAAILVFFGILVTSSAIAVVSGLVDLRSTDRRAQSEPLVMAILVAISLLCLSMPWVMNEMFRSGFFSTVAALALCSTVPVAFFGNLPRRVSVFLLGAVTVLTTVTYMVAAIYSILILAAVIAPWFAHRVRHNARIFVPFLVIVVVSVIVILPRARAQLASRLLLEGSIVYLDDSIWKPMVFFGLLLTLRRGLARRIGVFVAITSVSTAGFQLVARNLREDQGQSGYGYYGAKLAYMGLFLTLFILICICGSIVVERTRRSSTGTTAGRVELLRAALVSAGCLGLVASISSVVLPDSRGFYGSSGAWTQPSADGLELAVSYWEMPRVLFSRVSDPGNDRLLNFWHPFAWSGDPWNWFYTGFSDDPAEICRFIQGRDVLVVTTDPAHASRLEDLCSAKTEVIS